MINTLTPRVLWTHHALREADESPHGQAHVIHPHQKAVPDTLTLPPISTVMKRSDPKTSRGISKGLSTRYRRL